MNPCYIQILTIYIVRRRCAFANGNQCLRLGIGWYTFPTQTSGSPRWVKVKPRMSESSCSWFRTSPILSVVGKVAPIRRGNFAKGRVTIRKLGWQLLAHLGVYISTGVALYLRVLCSRYYTIRDDTFVLGCSAYLPMKYQHGARTRPVTVSNEHCRDIFEIYNTKTINSSSF
jgi:hypothetical protein